MNKKPKYKYECKSCKHLFDVPMYIRDDEIIDYGIGSRWVTLWDGEVCPECESDEYGTPDEDEDEQSEQENEV